MVSFNANTSPLRLPYRFSVKAHAVETGVNVSVCAYLRWRPG